MASTKDKLSSHCNPYTSLSTFINKNKMSRKFTVTQLIIISYYYNNNSDDDDNHNSLVAANSADVP